MRKVELYYNTVMNKLKKSGDFGDMSEEEIKEKMRYFTIAYELVKAKHSQQKRTTGNRYFDHLIGTLEIILNEMENPKFEELLVGLMHDIIEDTDITQSTIENIFGKKIASMVFLLSKDYSNSLPKEYYFMRLRYIDSVAKKVKIADRIYNLRTVNIYDNIYIQRKIEETEKYILPLCKDINSKLGEKIMLEEIKKLNEICKNRN